MRYIFLIFILAIIACSDKHLVKRVNENDLKTYFAGELKKVDSTGTVDSFKLIDVGAVYPGDQYKRLLTMAAGKLTLNNIKSDSLADADEANKIIAEDSLLKLDMDSLEVLMNKADNTYPVYLKATCFYQITYKDLSVIKDTAYILLDNDLNIVSYETFAADLKKLYSPFSNFMKDDGNK